MKLLKVQKNVNLLMDCGTCFSKYWLRNKMSFLAKVDYLFQAKSYNIFRKTKCFTSHQSLATEQELRKRVKFRLPSATSQVTVREGSHIERRGMRSFAARSVPSQHSKRIRNSGGFGIRREKPKQWGKKENCLHIIRGK